MVCLARSYVVDSEGLPSFLLLVSDGWNLL